MVDGKSLVELQNVGVYNKGGYLMLLAIQHEFIKRGYGESIVFCGEHGPGRNYFSLGANRMMQLPKVGRRNYPFLKGMLPLFPNDLRHRLGIAMPGEIDHIIDGAGFAYGDYWGTRRPTDASLERCVNVKKKGGKVILVPQALGPFEKLDVKESFVKLVDLADLIFARDPVSYANLTKAYGDRPEFHLSPDFTNLLSTPEVIEYKEGNVCVIPNVKMIKQGGADSTTYNKWLVSAIQTVRKAGNTPYWLIHEGEDDLKIARAVNNMLEEPLVIVEHDDPLHLKHRIKCARYIVVSRFHGLVSALSQSIPVITTSWSHKYLMVAKEYGVEQYLVDVYDEGAVSKMEKLVEQLNDSENYDGLVSLIGRAANSEKLRSREMWDKVFELLSPDLPVLK